MSYVYHYCAEFKDWTERTPWGINADGLLIWSAPIVSLDQYEKAKASLAARLSERFGQRVPPAALMMKSLTLLHTTNQEG